MHPAGESNSQFPVEVVAIEGGVIHLVINSDLVDQRVFLGTIDAEELARELKRAVKVAVRQLQHHPRLREKKK